MKKLTLYHEASSGGFKQWSIWLEKDKRTVTVEWGKVGHTLQTSSDTAKPKGKVGTKSYMDEEACAAFNMERQIRKKREEGYRETMTRPAKQDWLMALDKQFVPSKPRNDIEVERLLELEETEHCFWIQRKRDGQRILVLITRDGQVRIYSRRLDELTEHLPLLVQYIEKLGLPHGTVLDGELLVDRDGKDDFRAVGTITRSKPKLAAQKERELWPLLRFMVFDVLYLAGTGFWSNPYSARYSKLMLLIGRKDARVYVPELLNVRPGPIVTKALTRLMEQAKREGWEGLVLWEHDKGTDVKMGGKPRRCGCVKWKPKVEQDFIATGYYLGSGELSNVLGGLNLAEYAPDGTLRNCGNCGTGFDMQTRIEAMKWDYPCVVSVEFDKQEPEGKLRFPVFLKLHEDKTPEECIGRDLSNEEE